MRKISEILRLHHELHCSNRQIAKSLNISPSTVSDYLCRAKAVGLLWPIPQDISEEQLHQQLFLPVVPNGQKRTQPDWRLVHQELRKKGNTLMLLWREYRDIHPQGVGYSQFCAHYRAYMKQITPVMHQVHKAGEKTFVDYAGMTVPWIETSTGELYEAQIFVGCLGASQYTFVEATASQQLPDFIGSHVRMWAYFDGVSEIVVPDNLKSAVTKAHRYDPDINMTYQHLSEHYGVAIVPARSATPKDKAKVENAVLCVERQILAPLRHVTFTSLASLNQAIRERLSVFNQRSFQKMKTSRLVLFETLDKPALKPLPQESYQYADWKHVKINIDYHFVFDEHYYSVPYQYIHHVITIRATDTTIECFYQDKRVATHTRSYAHRHAYSTQGTHMPENHAAYAKWTPERIARWASKIGPYTKQFIEYMIASRPFPQQAFRACLGLLRLSTHYTEIRLEKACELGLAAGATRYQQIKTLLERNMDLVPQASSSSTPIILHHDNIRGADYYH